MVYVISVFTYKHGSFHAIFCLLLLMQSALMQLHLLILHIGYMPPSYLYQFSRPNIPVLIVSLMIFVYRRYYESMVSHLQSTLFLQSFGWPNRGFA